MNYWIITDTHFGHPNMEKYLGRPHGYEQKILKNLNVVKEEDVLIHLGDVAFNESAYWNVQLRNAVKGKMILTLGNHDKHSLTWYYARGWDFICKSSTLKIFGYNILFSHKPMDGDFDLNIFGHFHNNPRERWEESLVTLLTPKHKLMTLEHEYRPWNLKALIKKWS